MKLSAVQDIAAPPEAVFARIADFERFESRARARGAEVRPLTGAGRPGWSVSVDWQGVRRTADLVVETITPPEGYTLGLSTRGIAGTGAVTLMPAGSGTRLTLALDLGATTFAGRLLMQTLTFARPALEGALSRRLAKLAAEVERGA